MLNLTDWDRKFLRSVRIDSEPDSINRPTVLLVSATLARLIIAEFGELSIEAYRAYIHKQRQG